MIARWRGRSVVPRSSHGDVRNLVARAREARRAGVEFRWELSRDELERLREAVHHWGVRVRGKYKKFDSQVLEAANEVLKEPDSPYVLTAPKGSDQVDSEVRAARDRGRFLLVGHADADVILGYARAGLVEEAGYRVRLGSELSEKLVGMAESLGWDLARLSDPALRPALNALFGLPLDYGESRVGNGPVKVGRFLDLELHGPLHWSRRSELPWLFSDPVARETGVYLWTFRVDGRQHVHYVGQTGRSFVSRLGEHLSCCLSGEYSILDPDELARGRQKVVWRAASGGESYGETVTEFVARSERLLPTIRTYLDGLSFFLLPLEREKSIRDRVEGALGRHFRDHENPDIRRLFGTGVKLPARMPLEEAILCRFCHGREIAGFPDELAV